MRQAKRKVLLYSFLSGVMLVSVAFGATACNNNHTHTYTSTVTKEATCTEDGVMTYTCTANDSTYTEVIPATGHSYTETVVAPTCTEQGYTEHVCSSCGDSYKDTYTDATGHSYAETVVEATCTTQGYTEYVCTVCGDTYQGNYTDALGHQYEDTVVDATCTEDGYTEHTCTVCGDSYKDSYVSALGHDYVGVVTKAATCTSAGVMTYTCSHCGDSYTSQIAATGHKYNSGVVTKEATCTETGTKLYTCTVCGGTYTQTIAAKGHDYDAGVVTKDATCTEAGEMLFTCQTCGATKTQEIAPLGHSYGEWVETTAPTVSDTGLLTRTCSTDNSHTETFTLPALNTTDYTYEVTATCTTDGVGRYSYTIDGQMFTYEVAVAAFGHNYGEWVTTTTPTETAEGLLTRTCANDSSHTETFTLPALNASDYTYTVTTAATCEADGEGQYVYTKDGQTFTYTVVIPATGHNYGDWVETTAPTETTEGLLTRTCANDSSHTETVTLPMLDVNETAYNYADTVAPTCEATGEGQYVYTINGQTFTYTVTIPATGHSYGEWVETTAPTETTAGLLTRTCANDSSHTETQVLPALNAIDYTCTTTSAACETGGEVVYVYKIDGQEFTYKVTIAATGHNYVDTVTDPTCEEQGYTTHTCSKCGDSYVDTYTAAIGHDYDVWVETTAPTVSETGLLTRTCKNDATHTETYTLPALNDSDYYYTVPTPATCTTDGEGQYVYTKDGQTFTYTVTISATGHSYGDWEKTTDPTETTEGLLTRTCANDSSHTETYTLPALNDSGYYYTVTTAATCTTDGVGEYAYTIDGQTFTYTAVIPATGHTKVENPYTTNYSVCEGGTIYYWCSDCYTSLGSESVSGVGHNYVNGECTVCGAKEPTNIFVVSSVSGTKGSTVTVTVELTDVVCMTGFDIILTYDSSALVYVGSTAGVYGSTINATTAGEIEIVYTSSASSTSEGLIASITFMIIGSTAGDYDLTLTMDLEPRLTWKDTTIVSAPYLIVNGKVTIE